MADHNRDRSPNRSTQDRSTQDRSTRDRSRERCCNHVDSPSNNTLAKNLGGVRDLVAGSRAFKTGTAPSLKIGEVVVSQTMEHTLKCPVCMCFYDSLAHKPVSFKCGHTICSGCVARLSSSICPQCRKPISKETKPTIVIKDFLESAPFRCGTCHKSVCAGSFEDYHMIPCRLLKPSCNSDTSLTSDAMALHCVDCIECMQAYMFEPAIEFTCGLFRKAQPGILPGESDRIDFVLKKLLLQSAAFADLFSEHPLRLPKFEAIPGGLLLYTQCSICTRMFSANITHSTGAEPMGVSMRGAVCRDCATMSPISARGYIDGTSNCNRMLQGTIHYLGLHCTSCGVDVRDPWGHIMDKTRLPMTCKPETVLSIEEMVKHGQNCSSCAMIYFVEPAAVIYGEA